MKYIMLMILFGCLTALPTYGGTWSQSGEADFGSGELTGAVVTNGAVVLLRTREIYGLIANPGFEDPNYGGWSTAHNVSTTPCGTYVGATGATSEGTGIPSEGTRYLYHSTPNSPGVSDMYPGWSSAFQNVDFTDVAEVRFDAYSQHARVIIELKIDGTVYWVLNTGGAAMDASVDVSGITGVHELTAYMRTAGTLRSRYYAFWDNFRTYGIDPYYASAGTIVSEAIDPLAWGQWQTLTFSNALPANTSFSVDILDGSLALLATNVASGSDLAALGVTSTPIRLRANFATSDDANTPSLLAWSVSWEDDPLFPKLQFQEINSAVREDATQAVAHVTLSPVQTETVTVAYAISGGTATNGVDFTLNPGILTFAAGETNLPIVIDILDDDLIEGNETAVIALSNPSNAVITLQDEHVLTISGDADVDGMEDDWENSYFGDLSHDGSVDTDVDGMTDLEEFSSGTSPVVSDSDADGLLDGDELYLDGTHGDTDGYTTDPNDADTDDDGFDDGFEAASGRHPANPYDVAMDADGDGLPDYGEMLLGTDPTNSASPVTIYVNSVGGDDATGDGSIGNPYSSVQKGIDAAVAPTIVKISLGVYTENLVAKSGVALVGAGSGKTILDGGNLDKVIRFSNGAAPLVGMTIMNGQQQSGDYDDGGSAVYASGGAGYFCDVIVKDCVATFQKEGTIYMATSSLRMENCELRNNSDNASAVLIWSTQAEFINCLFANNSYRSIFNAISTDPEILLVNCTLANNGGGIQLIDETRGTISAYNSIFWGNGDELRGNKLTLDHCCVEDSDFGEGIIHSNPLFLDTVNFNYQLSSNSPCIDAGHGNYASPKDAWAGARVDHPFVANTGTGIPAIVDMGYLEINDTDSDGLRDDWEANWFGDLTHGPADHDDADSLTNLEEMEHGTNPTEADTDGDGLDDDDELVADGSPDTDGFVTDPTKFDTDGDGISDGEETSLGADGYVTNPSSIDSDLDGWNDNVELVNGTDPSDPSDLDEDTDGDGLPLFGELILGTDPADPASPSTIYVNRDSGSDVSGTGLAGAPFATISHAMNAVSAPAIIRIGAGTYVEQVICKPNVALVGAGRRATVVDPGNSGLAFSGVSVLVDMGIQRGRVKMASSGYLKAVDIRDIRTIGSEGRALEIFSTFRATGCRFVQNVVWHTLFAQGSGPTDITLLNCLIADNSKYAATVYWCNPFRMINCTIANNTGASFQQSSRVLVYNSICQAFNGGATYYYCSTGDPLFNSPMHFDYRLRPASPCIDAAEGFIAPSKDLAGFSRHDDPLVANANLGYPRYADVGCYEADFTDSDADGLLDQWEQEYLGTLVYDGQGDPDGDGLVNADEMIAYANPGEGDSDGDGLSDSSEYAMGSNPVNRDTDGDGVDDGAEAIAGTDLSDPDAFFRMETAPSAETPNAFYKWLSVTGRVYSVVAASNLMQQSWNDVPGWTDIPGTGAWIYYTNAIPSDDALFYRVQVHQSAP